MVENSDPQNMNARQDEVLSKSKEGNKPIKFILKNGVHIEGTVEAYDRYVVVIRQSESKQAMIYKSAFSTLIS